MMSPDCFLKKSEDTGIVFRETLVIASECSRTPFDLANCTAGDVLTLCKAEKLFFLVGFFAHHSNIALYSSMWNYV